MRAQVGRAETLRTEQGRGCGERGLVHVGEDLAQHPGQLVGHVGGVVETPFGFVVGGPPQQPVVGLVAAQERHRLAWRKSVGVAAPETEPEAEHRQGPADRVQIGADRGTGTDDLLLGHPVPGGAVDRALGVVHTPHTAQVDELDLLLALDDVVGFEVAVEQALGVQVPEGAQALQPVGDDLVQGQRLVLIGGAAPVQEQFAQGLAAHVIHDDVTAGDTGLRIGVLGEVDDLDDVGVLDLRQVLAFGRGGLVGLGVTGVEEALEHDPPVVDVAVAGEIDPAEAAVGQAAEHLVLTADHVALDEFGHEGEPGAAAAAEPLDAPGEFAPAAADLLVAVAAVTVLLRDDRVGHDRFGGVAVGNYRDLHQSHAEHAA